MLEKNSVFTGLVIGAVVPVLGFFAIEFIFDLLMKMELMEYVSGSGTSRRLRTKALIAICFNLIPLNIGRKNRWDDTMRGIVFPTLLYVGFWIYKFGAHLF